MRSPRPHLVGDEAPSAVQFLLDSPGVEVLGLLADLLGGEPVDGQVADITELVFGVVAPDEKVFDLCLVALEHVADLN